MKHAFLLLSGSLLLSTLAFAQERVYVYQEGAVRSKMTLMAPCPEAGDRMQKRKQARSAAIEQGFSDGGCLNASNVGEMVATFTVGVPAVYYLTPEELARFREQADAHSRSFITSESMPPEG